MADRKPNIILIMSDDLGYEVIGADGGSTYKTPRLDEMAAGGMRFENGHVMPLCTPTRVSLMTGKYNFRNYIGFGLMKPDEVTFGHLLSDAGYNTCISGKWQLYSYDPMDNFAERRSTGQRIEDGGFDEFCVWHAHHTEDKGSRYKNPIIYENGKYRDDTEGKYGDDVFCDYIIDFIGRKKDDENPFFVYWPMAATHKPHEPTPDSPEWDDFDPPDNTVLGAKTGAEMAATPEDEPRFYRDMVEYHDKVIGRLLDYLGEQGLSEDTMVIYVGDNGSPHDVCSMVHEHNEICGGKGKTNDRGTHVPLIVSMPGTVPAGAVQADMIESTDFLPTIFEAAGLDFPEGYVIDGRSFYPQLTGNKGNPRDWMFFHFEPLNRRSVAPRRIRYARDLEWNLYETGELYDLGADIDEEVPIYEAEDTPDQAEARARLKPIFKQMVN